MRKVAIVAIHFSVTSPQFQEPAICLLSLERLNFIHVFLQVITWQVKVSHQTLADQNLFKSDLSSTVAGDNVKTFLNRIKNKKKANERAIASEATGARGGNCKMPLVGQKVSRLNIFR